MSRQLRIEYPGAMYHVINRGNYRSWIFEDEGAKKAFEKALFEACEYAGWRLHAFVVMGNHFHLALETPEANLSDGMRWLQSVFANRFNRFRKESGKLFQGRFKSILVEDLEGLGSLCQYIHLNPVRAGVCDVAGLEAYRFGSYWYLRKRKSRPRFLELDTCLEAAGDLADSSRGWRKYAEYLQWLCEEEPARKSLRFDLMSKGWALGTKEFKMAVLDDEKRARAAIEVGEAETVGEVRELLWARRLGDCLRHLGKTEAEIRSGLKSADWKVAIASHLKSRMLCRNGWLANRLGMGTVSGVSRACSKTLAGRDEDAGRILDELEAQFKE
jgi:REP element-mobilizing transposase RayT